MDQHFRITVCDTISDPRTAGPGEDYGLDDVTYEIDVDLDAVQAALARAIACGTVKAGEYAGDPEGLSAFLLNCYEDDAVDEMVGGHRGGAYEGQDDEGDVEERRIVRVTRMSASR